ncbi:helix-turn-helix domain-containing protein [Variovorax sp. Sphag1AA]|uniref:helix-turn-helix domain-containing protein n=1 Tax=Variovorax sp. Sphag1AA TaxID=2587027 RepID=UPI00161EF27F|nr:helix-turn-helix domain-containing protein [Variovorax sp. Sphag1AA]MBB3181641.1 AraC-like DNA-binding protein [Variovorax sp. Sphag1AA]
MSFDDFGTSSSLHETPVVDDDRLSGTCEMPAPASSLPNISFDVARWRAGERLARWRSMVSTCDVETPLRPIGAEFTSHGRAWHLGKLVALQLSMGSQVHRRTRRHVLNDQIDHYRIALLVDGRQHCDLDDGRRMTMAPGDLLITDMARPECLHVDSDKAENIVLYIPREMLDESLMHPMPLHGTVPRGVAADVLADHLHTMIRHLPRTAPDEAAAMTAATIALVAASIATSRRINEASHPAVESTLLRQACRHIELHLNEETLSVASVAKFFQLSRSSLYRLFAPLGGVSSYIKERRLLRVHAALARSTGPLRVQRVAEAHGFQAFAHFSRGFREMFGYPPSEVRRHSVLTSVVGASPARSLRSVDAWLRSLRD